MLENIKFIVHANIPADSDVITRREALPPTNSANLFEYIWKIDILFFVSAS